MRREFPTVASAWVCWRSRGYTDLELRQDQGHFATDSWCVQPAAVCHGTLGG